MQQQRCLARLAMAVLASIIYVMPGSARQTGHAGPIEVDARPIREFRIGSPQTRFGPLEFVGGFSMGSATRHFGALSSFRFLEAGGDFICVADTGFWFFGSIERDADGAPVGWGDLRMMPMVDEAGVAIVGKRDVDAEGLDVHGDIVTVSFEHAHRISEFVLRPGNMGAPERDLDFQVPPGELRRNRGFETVARAPAEGHLGEARVVVSERSIDENGNLFAAILEGPEGGIFKVVRSDGFDVTDGAFLDNGDLLLLERRFSIATGLGMRLRRIAADTIMAGALVDGTVLFEADMAYQIDDMEGLDVWRRADGAQMVSLVSDDNHSILQRNLYLEFRLLER